MGTALAGSTSIEVPLTPDYRLDLDAMADAVRGDTTVVFLCNPNNPTGTHRSAADMAGFIDSVPKSVLVVVDEAYFEYVTAPDYRSALGIAVERPNVIVLRTFSKIYSLASLRVGYAVGQPSTLSDLRRAQAPFTVSGLAQVAALTAVRYPNRVAERAEFNAAERSRIEKALEVRKVEYVPSQANFVYLHPVGIDDGAFQAFLHLGVIVRQFGAGWIRVTIGSVEENERFLQALDALL
jgi:histidinol-phosphate aminotransferase